MARAKKFNAKQAAKESLFYSMLVLSPAIATDLLEGYEENEGTPAQKVQASLQSVEVKALLPLVGVTLLLIFIVKFVGSKLF